MVMCLQLYENVLPKIVTYKNSHKYTLKHEKWNPQMNFSRFWTHLLPIIKVSQLQVLSKNKLLTVRKMEIYYKDFNKHFLRLVDGTEKWAVFQ